MKASEWEPYDRMGATQLGLLTELRVENGANHAEDSE